MIEQQMQLHGPFSALVLRPVEDRGAQFDQRGVQREQFVFETETMAAGDFTAAAEQAQARHNKRSLARRVLGFPEY